MYLLQISEIAKIGSRYLVAMLTLQIAACRSVAQTETESSETLGSVVQFCPPFQTSLERSLWLSLVDHYVAKKLFSNYMSCTKKAVKLTGQEMADIHARRQWSYSPAADGKISRFLERSHGLKKPQKSEKFALTFLATAFGGTLGAFTVHFDGHMEYRPKSGESSEDVLLVGSIWYEDYWDFDVKGLGNRTVLAEQRTRVAEKYMSGKSFPVTSEIEQARISYSDQKIDFTTFKPQTDEPFYSNRAQWLVEQMKKAKKADFSLIEVMKMLADSAKIK